MGRARRDDDHGSMATTLPPPKLWRRAQGRYVGGVASGIADHLRIKPRDVRFAFLVLTAAGGLGVILYAVFWIVVPAVPGPDGRSEMSTGEYLVAAGASVVALVVAALTTSIGNLFVPSALGCVGAALLWRQAGTGERERWRALSRTSIAASADGGQGRVRLAAGIGLVLVGCILVLVKADITAIRDGLIAVVVTVVGIALITGPWWVRSMTELADERRERIRSQERADLAAHLHDSVLQTLALIQRNAGSPAEVARLARGQERELRALLYGDADPTGELSDAVRLAAAEVEDSYAIKVDVVVVGDAPLDDDLLALVSAAREAMVNAAKHASVGSVSVYVEVEQAAVAAYVRDRGVGFDAATIAEDRQGIRGSIIGRIERHGGEVTVKSTPGDGTEVAIRMSRTTDAAGVS